MKSAVKPTSETKAEKSITNLNCSLSTLVMDGMCRVISCIRDLSCVSVCTLKRKMVEQSTPITWVCISI